MKNSHIPVQPKEGKNIGEKPLTAQMSEHKTLLLTHIYQHLLYEIVCLQWLTRELCLRAPTLQYKTVFLLIPQHAQKCAA